MVYASGRWAAIILDMNKILVTDSLFIFPEHVKTLEAAGYEVERLDKPAASEAELIDAVKGKVGYILGGIEKVTRPVIDAADELKAIVFTGVGYEAFIPAWEYAQSKGIILDKTPDGATQAVAEWAVTAALAMNRGFFRVGRAGQESFLPTPGLEGLHIGIIGFGRIGSRIAEMIKPFQVEGISYYSRTQHAERGDKLSAQYASLDEVLSTSDVVFLSVPDSAGDGFIGASQLAKMKDDALLVSIAHPGIIDNDSLLAELQHGRLRAISDYPADDRFNDLPLKNWYCLNASNAFMTNTAIKLTSDLAVKALLKAVKSA
jgi:phosphoglycerate dehydrogenase-like enzyme